MNQTLNGEQWTELTANNKWHKITDRDMVNISMEIKGYIQYVYKFGCAFIHLSDFHNYKSENPFDKLKFSEKLDIKIYLNQYHGFPMDRDLTVNNIKLLIPSVFDKISANMACYYDVILNDELIEM